MQADCKKAVVPHQDDITTQLNSARAIIDCVRVLTSLERMPESDDTPDNGGGYARGNCTNDDSMSIALFHAMNLIDQANKIAEKACRIADSEPAIERRS